MLALAVPIRAPSGGILAALGVSVGAGRVSEDHLIKRVLPILRRSSDLISQGLHDVKTMQGESERGACQRFCRGALGISPVDTCFARLSSIAKAHKLCGNRTKSDAEGRGSCPEFRRSSLSLP